tara:strand:- start:27 stop:200 length:174 start_codon:yes stop_codon:yes gene_type:complete
MNIQTVKKNVIDGEVVSYQIAQQDSNLVLSVPLDTANTDYQAILEWVAEGNTIEEAV